MSAKQVKIRVFYILGFCILSMPIGVCSALAQEIVVEASRLEERAIEDSRTVTVLDSEKIRQKHPATIAEVLRAVPGLEVIQQGGVGQTASVFIRGARSEDTLVLIDGVEANDAMAPASGYDFSSLLPGNIERVEVFRGPQGVRFGSGALGGVINVITREGSGRPHANFVHEVGTYDTWRSSVSVLGEKRRHRYALGLEGYRTRGFSAATDSSGSYERDGARVGMGLTKWVWLPTSTARVETSYRRAEAHVDIDRGGGAASDDPNNKTAAVSQALVVTARERFFGSRWLASLSGAVTRIERRNRNRPDSASANDSRDFFLGENKKIESDHEILVGENHTLRANLQAREEVGRTDSDYNGTFSKFPRVDQQVVGGSLTYLYEDGVWFGDLGARGDHQSEIGGISSERLSAGRWWFGKRARTYLTYGTGYKLPSLYQLYAPTYGRKDLRHEYSRAGTLTLEGTVTKTAAAEVKGSVTVFENRFYDLIDYEHIAQKYFNISEARARGVEWELEAAFHANWILRWNYTYTDAFDAKTGQRLLRRPYHSGNIELQYQRKKMQGFLRYRVRGERIDADPVSFGRVRAQGYDLLDLGGSYEWAPGLRWQGRVENLADRRYEEVEGFGSSGLAVTVGLAGEWR